VPARTIGDTAGQETLAGIGSRAVLPGRGAGGNRSSGLVPLDLGQFGGRSRHHCDQAIGAENHP
jgi:hypothetical protein